MSHPVNQHPAPQGKEHSLLHDIWQWFRNTVLNNWPLKLLSLLIAVALWAGLITKDPTLTREKIFRDVPVAVNNSDILRRNGYVVTSDLDALLEGVDMVVDVPQMQFADVQPSNYNIRVDLNRLDNRTGEQELAIMTTSTATYGTVRRVTPPTITVMVEEYVTHSYIPVNVVEEGEVPEGFYAAGITRDPSWITVSGPRSLVEQVDRAQVVLDMSNLPAREGQVTRALTFTLLDNQGQPIVSDMLQVTRESVLRERINVNVTMYSKRDIDLLTAQLYSGTPAEGYEVTDVYVTPSYVTVAGLKSVVDTVDLIQLGRLVNISGATDTVTASIDLARPQNLQWISANRVSVTVVIQPKQGTARTLEAPVSVVGAPQGWTVTLSQNSATVSITGPADAVGALSAEGLQVICDVTGLAEGVHEAPLTCSIASDAAPQLLTEIEPQTVQLTLTAPEAP